MYYLQSRYYDPEVCRFINADEYASTGQGFVGYNMFAYCNNNPANCVDECGTEPISISLLAIAGAALFTLVSAVIASPGFQKAANNVSIAIAGYVDRAKDSASAIIESISQTKEENRNYTVYLLTESGKPDDGVVYVGRVKTANYKARMNYHESVGRAPYKRIDGLTYAECRGLEQILMMYYHTLQQGESLFNQIRGISPKNKNGVLYTLAGLEYISNQIENEFLNLPMSK